MIQYRYTKELDLDDMGIDRYEIAIYLFEKKLWLRK